MRPPPCSSWRSGARDGRLLWQLAELAGAFGDVRTAAAIMMLRVGIRDALAELRQHRQANTRHGGRIGEKTR